MRKGKPKKVRRQPPPQSGLEKQPPQDPRRPVGPRQGLVIGGVLVSGGALAQAIKMAAHSFHEPWKSLGENYAHWIASSIAAALYWTNAIVAQHWGPRQFARDRSRMIEVCRSRATELESKKTEVIERNLDPGFVAYLDHQLKLNTAQELLALSSTYPTRLWEAPDELLSRIEEGVEREASG